MDMRCNGRQFLGISTLGNKPQQRGARYD